MRASRRWGTTCSSLAPRSCWWRWLWRQVSPRRVNSVDGTIRRAPPEDAGPIGGSATRPGRLEGVGRGRDGATALFPTLGSIGAPTMVGIGTSTRTAIGACSTMTATHPDLRVGLEPTGKTRPGRSEALAHHPTAPPAPADSRVQPLGPEKRLLTYEKGFFSLDSRPL